MKLKDIIYGWDFYVPFLGSILCYFLPCFIPNELAKEFYSLGITTLSIVFSVFFAALAIIMASPEDGFIEFMNETNAYNRIVSMFKFTLILLFFGLLYSIIAFMCSVYSHTLKQSTHQDRFFPTTFIFIFFYSLFATLNSAKDAVQFSRFRTKFLLIKGKNKSSTI